MIAIRKHNSRVAPYHMQLEQNLKNKTFHTAPKNYFLRCKTGNTSPHFTHSSQSTDACWPTLWSYCRAYLDKCCCLAMSVGVTALYPTSFPNRYFQDGPVNSNSPGSSQVILWDIYNLSASTYLSSPIIANAKYSKSDTKIRWSAAAHWLYVGSSTYGDVLWPALLKRGWTNYTSHPALKNMGTCSASAIVATYIFTEGLRLHSNRMI